MRSGRRGRPGRPPGRLGPAAGGVRLTPAQERLPPFEPLRTLLELLERHGIETALGGSGLLAALGLTRQVRDWDLTTDSDPEAVEAVLLELGFPYARAARETPFATAACFRIAAVDHDIDVLVGFALETPAGVVPVRTRRSGSWRGVPVGDAAEWALAYRVLGRPGQADTLERWLRDH